MYSPFKSLDNASNAAGSKFVVLAVVLWFNDVILVFANLVHVKQTRTNMSHNKKYFYTKATTNDVIIRISSNDL